jgi:hypothetical protein
MQPKRGERRPCVVIYARRRTDGTSVLIREGRPGMNMTRKGHQAAHQPGYSQPRVRAGQAEGHGPAGDTPPRQCFYIPAGQFDELGWIPSVVTEGQPGHQPLAGNGPQAQPWHWGRTYPEAVHICNLENVQAFGLTPADAAAIIASSIAAGR